MRQFYLAYHGHEKLQPLVGEISWAKHLAILGKCKDPLERKFYIRMTKKFGWTKNVLIHQIENQSIGIILCKEKNRTVVEYSLYDVRSPIGVATYRTVKHLPKELKGMLPAPEEIAKLLEATE